MFCDGLIPLKGSGTQKVDKTNGGRKEDETCLLNILV